LPNSFWQKSLLSPNIGLYQEISRTKNGFNEKLTKEVFCWKKNLKRLDDTPSAKGLRFPCVQFGLKKNIF